MNTTAVKAPYQQPPAIPGMAVLWRDGPADDAPRFGAIVAQVNQDNLDLLVAVRDSTTWLPKSGVYHRNYPDRQRLLNNSSVGVWEHFLPPDQAWLERELHGLAVSCETQLNAQQKMLLEHADKMRGLDAVAAKQDRDLQELTRRLTELEQRKPAPPQGGAGKK